MSYDVYLGDMLLPVTPERITTQINGKNETAVLINDGEINILKTAGLTTVSFAAYLPNVSYPFARYPNGFKHAGYFIEQLERLMTEKKPFQFIVTRQTPVNKTLLNSNMTVALENYQILDDAKNGFDMEVQIELKQFKAYGTKTFTVTTPAPSAPAVVNASRMESTVKKTTSNSPTQKSSKTKMSTYKVQIPGMSVFSVSATSIQSAITKACGSSWTGTVYVNGTSYYVVKGVIGTKPSTTAKIRSSVVAAAASAVTGTIDGVVIAATTVVNNVLTSLKEAATKTGTTPKTTTTVSKAVSMNNKSTMVMLN